MSRRARRQQEELEELNAAAALQAKGQVVAGTEVDDDRNETLDQDQPAVKGKSAFAAVRRICKLEYYCKVLTFVRSYPAMPLQSKMQLTTTKVTRKHKQRQRRWAETAVPSCVLNRCVVQSKSKKKKKKKKQSAVNVEDEVEGGVATPVEVASVPTSASKKSKAKSKGNKAAECLEPDDGLDEIDRALRDLGSTPGQASTSTSSPSVPIATSRIRSLLSVEPKYLDADAELKRFFGASVVQSAAVKPELRGARAQNPHHALHRQFSKGGMLARPGPNWPPAAFSKSGLSMEVIESSQGETLWTFVHSKGYKEVTQMFLEAVSSMDPNQLMALLHVHPYHAETLLGLSDMAAQQGDPGMSQDFLDRALYSTLR